MKRRVEQMINGKFEYKVPKLLLSVDKIQVKTLCGKNCQREIYLGTEENQKVQGYVSSSHRRLIPEVSQFSGTTVRISCGIDVEGMNPGESFQGNLCFLTNFGEYQVPFYVEIEKVPVTSTSGQIASLEAFAQLARKDFREAFRLFTSDGFRSIMQGAPRKERALYLGMTHNPVTYQHLEEFLIGAGQKEPVQITWKEDQASFYQVKESRSESFQIQRSGWGFLRLEVETRGDFLSVSKHVIREEDFIGSIYQVDYVIHESYLGKGKNFGEILVKSPYRTFVYQVMASRNQEIQVNVAVLEKKKKVELAKGLLDLKTKKTDYRQWAENTRQILRELKEAGCDYPEYQMCEAFLHYQDEEAAQAQAILRKYENKSFTRKDLEFAGIYLYLSKMTGLIGAKKNISSKIRSFYNQKPDSFLLLWTLLQTDEEIKRSPSKALFMLEEQYDRGCRNPFLYLEAWQMVTEDISLLRRLSGFWVQVFLFAGKRSLLTEELSMRLAYLSGYEKRFSRSLYMALCKAYEQFPSDDTLEAVCKHIMKGNPRKREFFPWFSLAVEHGLRLTRLYEYYAETMDCSYQRELPRTLKMYFSYNNTLGSQKRAYIYANIVQNKEKDVLDYENYEKIIRSFGKEKIIEGKINEDYAAIYQEFLSNPASEQEAENLAQQIFTCRLYCDDPKVRNVIVRHSQFKTEDVYPCTEGVAYPKIYTKDAVILFEDDRQRRYAKTVEYNLTRLMDEKELVKKCRAYPVKVPGFLLHVAEHENVDRENLNIYQQLLDSPAFTEEYKVQLRRKMLEYYSEHAQGEDLDDYLGQVDLPKFASVDKKTLMEIMIARGMFTRAYEVLCSYGYEGIQLESLVKLCSRMIQLRDMEEEDELTSLASYVFEQGKYDEVILTYLIYYFMGPLDEFLKLWTCARDFQADTYELDEKILQLLMLVWDYRTQGAQVLQDYISQRGKERLILAYLNFCAYGYFMKGKALDPFLAECFYTAYRRGWNLDMVCMLSLFQLYAHKEDRTDEEEAMLRDLLKLCAEHQYRFQFFEQLPKSMRSPYQLDDKVFAECRTDKDAKVTLYYALDQGLDRPLKYKSEPIKAGYEGVFVKTFTLFYGEVLHYYFGIETEEGLRNTEERTLTVQNVESDGQSKYQLLNQMLAARVQGRRDEAADKMRKYLQQEDFVKKMYQIEKE